MTRGLALALLAALAACAPPLEGAACTTHASCPTGQRCTAECVCVAGERPAPDAGVSAGTAVCPGFRPMAQSISLPGTSTQLVVQVASQTQGAGQLVAVALDRDDDGVASVRLFARGADAWTAQGGGVRSSSTASLSPMGLAPDGSAVLVRLQGGAGVTLFPLQLGGLGTGTTAWSVPAAAVAFGERLLVASLDTVVGSPSFAGGVYTRRTPLQVPNTDDGDLLHADIAIGLQVSRDGQLVVTQGNAGSVRVFRGGTQRPWTMPPPPAVQAMALAANGTRLALARGGGVELVDPDSGSALGQLAVAGVKALALDGAGTTLVALADEGAVVFALVGTTWRRLGVLPLGSPLSGVALSGDGRDLFVGSPATQQVRVLRRVE